MQKMKATVSKALDFKAVKTKTSPQLQKDI